MLNHASIITYIKQLKKSWAHIMDWTQFWALDSEPSTKKLSVQSWVQCSFYNMPKSCQNPAYDGIRFDLLLL